MIYVASPYYNFDKSIIEERVKQVALYAGKQLVEKQETAVSPVLSGHIILQHCSIVNDFSAWDKYSFDLLSKCDELHVLLLDGWKVSKGVTAEINFAEENNIPVRYIEY